MYKKGSLFSDLDLLFHLIAFPLDNYDMYRYINGIILGNRAMINGKTRS